MQNELENFGRRLRGTVREFQSRVSTPVPTGVSKSLSIPKPSQTTPEFEKSKFGYDQLAII